MSGYDEGAACGRHGFVVPARRDRWPNFGLLAIVLAAGGLLSGVFLSFHYAPTLDAARDSVHHIQDQVTGGSWLRGIHHWAANFAIVLAALHGLRLFWHGAYKKPRRAMWVIGCGIFLVIVGFAYTGYLLPGDERAYAGLGIMKAVAGATPIAGDAAAKVAIGGDSISSATLTRLYAIHTMVLPIALALLLGAFFYFWRCVGPARHHADDTDETASAWTFAVQRDATAGLVVLGLIVLFAWIFPPSLGLKADPGGAGAPDAQPEWFLLWVNELLHMEALSKIPNATFVLAGLIPGVLVALGIGLPLLFRKPDRDPRKRKPELVLAGVILLGIGILGGMAAARAPAVDEPDEDETGTTTTTNGGVNGDTAALDEAAARIIKKFKCATCHTIDGDEDGGDTGPALWRDGSAEAKLPAFPELYTRAFFRRKVGDPEEFWIDTGMTYPRRAG
ncbi:MAG: cytochrome bc complex cytochrome b subunit, partial [Planctomycetota bacterium]|nr:cytochrome bc complex cytochrome b subunit [Planctomycetota bacterium]